MYTNENRLISKARKSAKRIFAADDKRWFLKLIKNNPKLHSTRLVTEKHLHNKVNHDRSQRVLRKNYFPERVVRKNALH